MRLPTSGNLSKVSHARKVVPMRVDRAAGKHNSSKRLREGLRLARALNVAMRGILQEIVPSLAPRALVKIVRKVSPDQAVVVIVEEVGEMVAAVAVGAAKIKRDGW